VGILLGVIAVIFVLGFFSLAQTVQVSTTGVDIDRLTNQESALEGQRQQVISDLNRLGGASAIRKLGIDLGLNQLGDPIVVPAR
jgi:CBS domain containing-hemolysin-like protein